MLLRKNESSTEETSSNINVMVILGVASTVASLGMTVLPLSTGLSHPVSRGETGIQRSVVRTSHAQDIDIHIESMDEMFETIDKDVVKNEFINLAETTVMDTPLYFTEEQTLKKSATFVGLTILLLGILAVFNVVHWALWVPGIIAAFGVAISNGIQLNKIDEFRDNQKSL